MRITIFGANGGIGKHLVNKALSKGFYVKAYVRDPAKIQISNPNLEILKGELNDFQKIKKVIIDSNAVISTLGPPLKYKYKGHPILDGHLNIIHAMIELNISRFITLATPSIRYSKDEASIATKLPGIIARIIYPSPYKEIIQIGKVVQESDLDWTIVRIIAPNNKPESNNIKVSFGDKKIKFDISREDIANFMLNQITDKTYIQSMPIIGS